MKNKLSAVTIITLLSFSVTFFLFCSRQKPSDKPQIQTPGALKALDFWTRLRAYPQKDIPMDKYFKEYQRVKTKLKEPLRSFDDTTSWEPMGPYNIPGRMISVAVNPLNPQILYAGSASGGLWRTNSAETGANWKQVVTGFPTLGVMGIAIDPTDTNTIYIGTGEVYGYKKSIGGFVIRTTRGSYGIGILKTTDGGKSWSKSLDWSYHQERGVQCIRINPLNPQTVYAATSEGIYKSTDAGEKWQNVLPVLMGEDIVIHAVDTSKIMVSCGNFASTGSGLYRSEDAGKNWTKLTGIPSFTGKTLLGMYASNPDIVFASVADSLNGIGLYRTDDFGTNWTVAHTYDVPSYQGWFSHWVAVHPLDSTQIVHAGVSIYKSNDGGQTLTEIYGPHADHHNYAHDPVDPDLLYIVCDGGIYRSTNFGDSYQNIGYALQTAQFYNGFSSSSSDSMLAMGGLQDNGTVIFYGTKDWTHVIGGDGCWTAINPSNDNILYGEYQYNNIQKSTNRGGSFFPATNGITGGGAAFVAPFIISPSGPSILYSGRRHVYKTTDAADNWVFTNDGAQLDGNSVLSMAASATNPDIVYAGTGPTVTRAHIFRTTNGGDSWSNVTGSLPDRYPMDLAVDPNDDQTVYAVFGGFGSGHVFKSIDAGENWQDISGILPDVPTLAIAIDPLNSEHIYVGNDLGVYASTDAGTTWATYNNGLPEAVIAMDLNISRPDRKLRIATHGNGAYQRPLLVPSAPAIVYSEHWIDDDNDGDSQGNDDSIVNFSESVELPVMLKNIGKLTAYDVKAVLSTDNEYVNIIDSVESFGNIPGRSTALSSEDFDFDVSAQVPNEHIITFRLSISDSIDGSWEDKFDIQAVTPELVHVSSKAVDSLGNNNGFANPGETIDLFITILNEGGQDATNVSATLVSLDPYAVVNIGESMFGNIPAYGEVTSISPYNVSIDPGCPEPYGIQFTLSITADNDYLRERSIFIAVGEGLAVDVESIPTGWTNFAFTEGYVDEWHRSTRRNHTPGGNYSWKCGAAGTGNYSDLLDAALVTPLINIGDNYQFSFWHWIDAEEDASSTAWDGGIVMMDDGTGWTQIEPIGGYPYRIIDNPASPFEGGTPCFSGRRDWAQAKFDLSGHAGSALRFMFRFGSDGYVTEEGWYIDDISVFGTGPADVLVVDDDGGNSYETYFTQSLERIGVSFDNLKSEDGITSSLLSDYKTAIWFTGDNPHPVDSSSVLALSDYLDSGGNLFISGQDVEGCVDTNFYRNYLHASLVQDSTTPFFVDGVESDPIGDDLSFVIVGAGGANNQVAPSIISPIGGADSIFNRRFAGCCGVKYGNSYKVVYLSFGFEAINNVSRADTVMMRILKWFDLSAAIEEEVAWSDPVGRTRFLKTRPNPFREELKIEYAVQNFSVLELRIYDITGRMVRELLREPKRSGIYRVKWDGTNSLGVKVPQGVYFLHLSDGKEDRVKKSILLR